MQDGSWETSHLGKIWVQVQRVEVSVQAIERRLVFRDMIRDCKIRLDSLGRFKRFGFGSRVPIEASCANVENAVFGLGQKLTRFSQNLQAPDNQRSFNLVVNICDFSFNEGFSQR